MRRFVRRQMRDAWSFAQGFVGAIHGRVEIGAADRFQYIACRLHLIAEHGEVTAGCDEDDGAVIALPSQEACDVQAGRGRRVGFVVGQVTVEQHQVETVGFPALDEIVGAGEGAAVNVKIVLVPKIGGAHGLYQLSFGRMVLDDCDAHHVPPLAMRPNPGFVFKRNRLG